MGWSWCKKLVVRLSVGDIISHPFQWHPHRFAILIGHNLLFELLKFVQWFSTGFTIGHSLPLDKQLSCWCPIDMTYRPVWNDSFYLLIMLNTNTPLMLLWIYFEQDPPYPLGRASRNLRGRHGGFDSWQTNPPYVFASKSFWEWDKALLTFSITPDGGPLSLFQAYKVWLVPCLFL